MFCEYCGKELAEGSKFCAHCGSKVDFVPTEAVQNNIAMEAAVEEQTVTPAQTTVEKQMQMPTPEQRVAPVMQQAGMNTPYMQPQIQPKKSHKAVGIVVGIVSGIVLILAAVLLFVFLRKPTISLNEYIEVDYEGYDTLGEAKVSFNTGKFEKEYESKISDVTRFLERCVDGSLSQTTDLSNGDVITYTWDCKNALAEEVYHCKLEYSELSFTVEHLKSVDTFDAFETLEVIFEGIAPNGTAYLNGKYEGEASDYFYYECDVAEGLSNNDKVTVTITGYNEDWVKDCIENCGVRPLETKKTYEVTGLMSYVQAVSEIPEASMEELKQKAEEYYRTNVADDWEEDEELKEMTFLGTYFVKKNPDSDSWFANENQLYLVYRILVKNEYSNGSDSYKEKNEIYWYIGWSDLKLTAEKQMDVAYNDREIPRRSFYIDSGVNTGWFSRKYWYYYGYETLEALLEKLEADSGDYLTDNQIDTSLIEAEPKEEEDTFEVFADSSDRLLKKKEIKNLTDEELRYAINEIYARHGYKFKDEELYNYFSERYTLNISPDEFDMDCFNDTEMKNIELLKEERDKR